MRRVPERHALLGPSSAHRWLQCPPSARLEEDFPEKDTAYTREGTLAHRLAELRLKERWYDADIAQALEEVTADPLYSPAMAEFVDGYVAFIDERMADAKTRCGDPQIFVEHEIHYEDYVPEGFGTADCIIVADEMMDVIDFKYGQGVAVSAEGNPQMMIYGLGSYLALNWLYRVNAIRTTIYQPRKDNISSAIIATDSLLEWAKTTLATKATLAWHGQGEFGPSEDACRWCKAAATCRARAEYQLQLAAEDFDDHQPATLSPEEIASVLTRLPDLLNWAEAVKAYAQEAAVNDGATFPGFKLVEGRSTRKYTDQDAIAAKLRKAGFKAGEIYKPKELLGLTAMEKLVGKKRLEELAGQYIVKPEGAPTLVPETDKRPAINTAAQAADDFKEE